MISSSFSAFIPFIIVIAALIATYLYLFLLATPSKIMTDFMLVIAIVVLIIICVLFFVANTCTTIHPRELFVVSDINAVERNVCSMMSDVIGFKQGELGLTDPIQVADMVHGMVGAVDGTLTQCIQDPSIFVKRSWIPEGIVITDDMFNTQSDLVADRVARMDRSLRQFVEPQAARTFAATKTCESFESFASFDSFEPFTSFDQNPNQKINEQIESVRRLAATIQSQYLAPIQRKQDDLRAGKLSDCDRQLAFR